MKLRNKKTGEIVKFSGFGVTVVGENKETHSEIFGSLAELNEEWEDYEEPKVYWCIDCDGTLTHGRDEFDTPFNNACKSLGNYFETEEEAEKAVEKLKAWKRLKDKGFRFKKWESYEETSGLYFPDNHIVNSYTAIFDFNKPCRKHEIENEAKADLDLLFGGEE